MRRQIVFIVLLTAFMLWHIADCHTNPDYQYTYTTLGAGKTK